MLIMLGLQAYEAQLERGYHRLHPTRLRRAPAKVRAVPARLAHVRVLDTRRAGDAGRSAAISLCLRANKDW